MLTSERARLPYPGLRPFEADEADLFFGREQHVDALLARLSRSHFVAVVGESGAGKSSLVRAGLLPALEAGFVVEAGSDWRVAVMRPGGAPLTALADALLAPGVLCRAEGPRRREFALADLRRGPFGLIQLVRDAHLDAHCNTLIVVDQFEELFRYCREPGQKDQANVFVELLLQASQQRDVPIFVVLTMRSDFVGDCARFRRLPECLNDNQYLTPRLTRDQIAAAIREPARVCGGIVEHALVDELCNAVGDNQDQLPLLQHLMMRVWVRAQAESSPPRLTPAISAAMGGLRSALNNHAQQIYESLSPDRRAVVRVMFTSLTDPLSHRRDVRRDALASEIAAVAAAPVEAVIEAAEEFRAEGRHMLMPPPALTLNADSRLDISHESLLRQWSTLSEWACQEGGHAREFQRLRDEAQREREEKGELLSGRDLARAQDWIRTAKPTPAWAERYAPAGELDATLTFIGRSDTEAGRRRDQEVRAAAREASARRSRYYLWLSGGALVLASLVTIAIFNLWREAEHQRVVAGQKSTEAERQRGEADRQRDKATEQEQLARTRADEATEQGKIIAMQNTEAHSRQLAANALLELPRDPALALVLARAAVLENGADEQALFALRTVFASHVPNTESRFDVARSRNYLPGSEKGLWLDFSLSDSSLSRRSGLTIVPSGKDAIIWSSSSTDPTVTLKGHEEIVGSAIFSPDGRLAVTTSGDGSARVWDASTGRPLGILRHEQMVNSAAFNRNGTLLVTLGDDNLAQVWDVGNYTKPRCELRGAGNFIEATFSHDQTLLVTVMHVFPKWRVRVWNVARDTCPAVPVPFLEAGEHLKWASFSDHGPWLGLVTDDGGAILLSTSDWTRRRELAANVPFTPGDEDVAAKGPPPRIAWSHDGGYFAVAGADDIVRIAAVEATASPIELRGHTGRVTDIRFHPDDDMLLTTSADRTARLWRLGTDKRPLESLVLRGHKGAVGSGAFSPKGDEIVTAGDDGRLRSWKPLFALRERVLPGPRSASYSADGRTVWVSGTGGADEGYWISPLSADTLTPRGKALEVENTTPAFRGSRIVETANDGGVSVRDVRDPPGVRLLPESTRLGKSLTWGASPSGRIVFARNRDQVEGFAAVWDVNTPRVQPQAVLPPSSEYESCQAMAISDDKRLAWYCAEPDIVVIARAGQPQAIISHIEDEAKAGSMRFSQNGRWLAGTFEDNSVRLFHSDTGLKHVTLAHGAPIGRINFSADERFLVSASEDGTARVWEVTTGIEIAALAPRDVSRFSSASFSPDGLSLLLVAPDRVLLWRCYACGAKTALLDQVTATINRRTLSADERARFGLSSPAQAPGRPDMFGHAHSLQQAHR